MQHPLEYLVLQFAVISSRPDIMLHCNSVLRGQSCLSTTTLYAIVIVLVTSKR